MKLSDETVEIINNFKLMNPGLVFKKGSVIKTVSSRGATPIAIAHIAETFPVDFAISDLHRFLTVFNLLDDPDLEFSETDITMTDASRRTAIIRFSKDEMVKHFDYSKKIVLPSEDVRFKLTASDYKSIKKAADYFIAPEIAVIGDGRKIILSTFNSENPKSSDNFSIDLNIETDQKFEFILQTEYMNIVSRDYEVIVSFKGIAEFKGVGENSTVHYYLAASDKSKVY